MTGELPAARPFPIPVIDLLDPWRRKTKLVVVLSTDRLIGVAACIILKMVIHVANGAPLKSLFKPYLEVQELDDNTSLILAHQSAVFSNWIAFPLLVLPLPQRHRHKDL